MVEDDGGGGDGYGDDGTIAGHYGTIVVTSTVLSPSWVLTHLASQGRSSYYGLSQMRNMRCTQMKQLAESHRASK